MKAKKKNRSLIALAAIFSVAVLASGPRTFGSEVPEGLPPGSIKMGEPAPPPAQKFDPSQVKMANVVATVNVNEAKIVSQEGNRFNLHFVLSNRQIVQPEVRYAVQLLSQVGSDTNYLVDERVYDESMQMNENSTVERDIEYSAPEYLSGKFKLKLAVKNSTGLAFGFMPFGEIELKGSGKYVKAGPQDCYLRIEGKDSGKKIPLMVGVDILRDEKLSLVCDFENLSGENLKLSPNLSVFVRTTFGEKVSEKSDSLQQFSLAAGEKKTVALQIANPEASQAYDVKARLVDEAGKTRSNYLLFHFVLRGNSASIQNVRVDKDYYAAGEKAKTSLYWSGAADNFLGARVSANKLEKYFLNVTMGNDAGIACAAEFKGELDARKPVFDFELPIEKDCLDPILKLQIRDENGAVLAEKTHRIKSTMPEKAGTTGGLDMKRILMVIFVGLPVLIIFYLFFKKKGRRGIASVVLFCGLVGLGTVAGNDASADTFSLGGFSTSSVAGHFSATINLPQGPYDPAQLMGANSYVSQLACDNTGDLYLKLTWNDNGYLMFDQGCLDIDEIIGRGIGNRCSDSDTNHPGYMWAPYGVAGWTNATFRADYKWGGYYTNNAVWDPTQYVGGVQDTEYMYLPYLMKNPAPRATHDGVDNNSCTTSGWAFDMSDPYASIDVHVYMDGPAGGGGVGVGAFTANASRPDVQSAFGLPMSNYGFGIDLKGTAVQDGQAHSLYVYPIDNPTGWGNPSAWVAAGTPKTIKCTPAAPNISIAASPNPVVGGAQARVTWSNSGGNPTQCWAQCYKASTGAAKVCSGFDNSAGTAPFSGTYNYTMYEDTRFDVTCANTGGTSPASVTVNVIGSTVSGRVYRSDTNAGFPGEMIETCSSGVVVTNATGNFSVTAPYGTPFCFRLVSPTKTGLNGPIALNNRPAFATTQTYEYQRSGLDCAASPTNPYCGLGWNEWDRSIDTNFDFKYVSCTGFPSSPPAYQKCNASFGDSGDDKPAADTAYKLSDSCTVETKCEYLCPAGKTYYPNLHKSGQPGCDDPQTCAPCTGCLPAGYCDKECGGGHCTDTCYIRNENTNDCEENPVPRDCNMQRCDNTYKEVNP